MDPDDISAGDTVYYRGMLCEVIRGYNGLNISVQVPGQDVTTLVNPTGVDPVSDLSEEEYAAAERRTEIARGDRDPEPPDSDSDSESGPESEPAGESEPDPDEGDEDYDGEGDDGDEDEGGEGIPVTGIGGIAEQTSERLADAGITTVGDLLDAGVEGLVDAGISEGWAENYVESAREIDADL